MRVCVCCLCLMHALQLCDLQSFLKASCNCCSCTLALLADSASSVFTMLSQQLWTARRRRRFSGSGLRPDFCRCCSVLYLFMPHFSTEVQQVSTSLVQVTFACRAATVVCSASANFDCRTASFQDIQLLRRA